MRRLLCVLLGHRFGDIEQTLGFDVRRCARCGRAEAVEATGYEPF